MGRDELSFEGGATLRNGVVCTRHYEHRFAERVSRKSKRWEWFAQQAYEAGKRLEDIRNSAFRYFLASHEAVYGGEARVYAGCVYWFIGEAVVTVYQVPREFRGGVSMVNRKGGK